MLEMTPNFIIRVNPSTSMLEMKVELLNNKFSSEEDYEVDAHRGKFELIVIQIDGEAFSLKGGNFLLQNPSKSGSGFQW